MFANVREDMRRCGDTPLQQIREIALNIGMWAVVSYRFRRGIFIFQQRLPRLLRLPFTMISVFFQVLTEVITGIQIPCSADIGGGLYVPHVGYLVVSSQAVIGKHCTLTQGVTIGHGGGGNPPKHGCPVLGDRVYVGPGSILIGPITVGSDALIGAGAIVTRSVPERGVVAGNPARLLSSKGSFDLITYVGMDSDPARRASREKASRETGKLHEDSQARISPV